ncbi:MAG: hypothetical protein M1457_00470, partial [bacterium]|nr:hypothetical protein [bacterium]
MLSPGRLISRRAKPTRRRAAGALLAMYAAAVALRFAFSRYVSGPDIFADEWSYLEMARWLPQGRDALDRAGLAGNPC